MASLASPPTHTENARRTVAVSNLGKHGSITLKQLNTLFSSVGQVDIAYRTPSKDVAHVVFTNQESCEQALSLSGTPIKPDSSADLEPRSIVVTLVSTDESVASEAKQNDGGKKVEGVVVKEKELDEDEDEEEEEEVEEEMFGGFDLGALLFDDPQNSHGDPGIPYVYPWPENALTPSPAASLTCRVPESENCALMAHFVWESSIKMADLVATGIIPVQNRHVLEVGAGAGLPSILSVLMDAAHVIATDYPEPSVIAELKRNMDDNILSKNQRRTVQVMGHSWGTNDCGDLPAQFPSRRIDVILAADTLWLHDQHDNLFSTLKKCLTHVGSVSYFTYQHHNEHAPSFFEMIVNYSKSEGREGTYEVAHVGSYGWGGRELDEFDSDDEEKMGPIYLSTVTKIG